MSEALPSAARRCCLCDRGLNGYILNDPRGRSFCREHLPAVRLCRYCQFAFLDTERRDVCGCCRGSAVVTDNEARRLVAIGPLDWFGRHGLATGCGAQQIRVSREMPPHASGREMFGYVRYEPLTEVVFKRGLPRPVFLVVAAHELGHLWLFEAGARLSARMAEGVCDWLSWRFARDVRDPECAWLAGKLQKHAEAAGNTAFREVRERLGDVEPSALPSLLRTFPRRVLN